MGWDEMILPTRLIPSHTAPHPIPPSHLTLQNKEEKTCFTGSSGLCLFELIEANAAAFVPLPTPRKIASECVTTDGMHALYVNSDRTPQPRDLYTDALCLITALFLTGSPVRS